MPVINRHNCSLACPHYGMTTKSWTESLHLVV